MADLRAAKRSKKELTGAERLLNLGDYGVLEFNGKKFAVGLLWLTIDEPNAAFSNQKSLMDARRALINPDFVCDRSVIIAQQGYGHLSKGHRMGMPVAAAAAADLLVGEWHGVFKADNGWWYVAVHGDAIAPDGDVFFASEEEAYQHFMAATERQRWPRSYAPKEWAVAGTNHEIDIDKLLSGLPTTYLKPFTLNGIFGDVRNKYLFFVVSGFVIFLLASFLTTGLGDYMSAVQPVQRVYSADVPDPLTAPPRFVSKDFIDGSKLLEVEDYSAPALVKTCLRYFEDVYQTLPGWQVATIRCGDGVVTAEWTRKNARISDLGGLRRFFPEAATMNYDGQQKLTVSEPLNMDNVTKSKMQVLRKEVLYALVTNRLESKGTLALQEIDAPAAAAPPPPPGVPAPPPPAPERVLSVQFTTPLAAHLWADDFDIPALKPIELKWSIPDSSWTMTAVVKYQ